jgi:hypothetical protein
MMERFTLSPNQWYGWTMFPGYAGSPYHSPIRVDRVRPVPNRARMFDLDFFNMGYAAGVQMMTYRLRTLRREAGYILAEEEGSDRSVAIIDLDPMFVMVHAPHMTDRIERLMEQLGSFHDAMDALNGFSKVEDPVKTKRRRS